MEVLPLPVWPTRAAVWPAPIEKSIPFKPGGKVTYDKTYAYDPSFESSDLIIDLKAYKGAIGNKEKNIFECETEVAKKLRYWEK